MTAGHDNAAKLFGSALKHYRENASLSPTDAAEDLNISEESLRQLENGQALPSHRLLGGIGMVYGLTTDRRADLLMMMSHLTSKTPSLATVNKRPEIAKRLEVVPSLMSRVAARLAADLAGSRIEADDIIQEPNDPKALVRGLSALTAETLPVHGSGIFISYRRSDEPGLAGRLYDKLVPEFGENQVFMDVDSIELGLDFVDVLNGTLAHCEVLLVVIGRGWLSASDEDGARRLDDADDFVRLEIETALSRDIRVIPILVDGTRMPRANELPNPIKALSRRSGRDVSNARFNSDCLEIVSTIKRIRDHAEPPVDTKKTKPVPGPPETHAYSANDFNMEVTKAIQQTWFDCFGDRTHMDQACTRSDGGVDGVIWPLQVPGLKVAFKTFPSPDTKLRSYVAEKSLAGMTEPCLIVTRLDLHPGTRATIEKAYPHPLQFLRWSGSGDEEELEIRLRILKDATNKGGNDQPLYTPIPPPPERLVPREPTIATTRYVRNVLNQVSKLAKAAIGDDLETIRTEDKVDGTDFVTILAPTRQLNAEFAVKVAWELDHEQLLDQALRGRLWMRNHQTPGIIIIRGYPPAADIDRLNLIDHIRQIELLLWRDERDDEALEECLRKITGCSQ